MVKKFGLFSLFGLLIFFALNTFPQQAPSAKDKTKRPAMGPQPVEVARITKVKIRSVVNLVGTIESPRISDVGTEVEGLVKEILVKEGETVKEGDKMVILENSQLRIQLEEARAALRMATERLNELRSGPRPDELARAEAAMLEAKLRWSKAEKDYQRNKELFEKKVISERAYTNSRLEAEAARELYQERLHGYRLLLEGTRRERIAQEEANVRMMTAKMALIQERLRKKTIRAPFKGVVVERFVEKGEWIQKGKALIRLVQLDPLRVEVPVPEKIIAKINRGDSATMRFDSWDQGSIKGKVDAILPVADTASRTYPVRILIKNPAGRLKVGMIARVSIHYGPEEEVLMVPQDALIYSGSNTLIALVGKDRRARLVPVSIGRVNGNWIEVKGELEEGQSVVIKGNERILPGQPLQPLPSSRKPD